MDSGIQKSILQMARGAIQERADYEMSSLLNNILDPNTSATAARKLTITLTLKPDDTRQNITVSCVATSKLAATNPVTTALYVADEDMLEAADGQTTISYEAYYTSGTQDIESVSNGVNYWGEIEINFIPMEAQVVPK